MPTTRLGLDLLAENQSGASVVVNDALNTLDAAVALLAVANTYTARNDFTQSVQAVTTWGNVNLGSGGFTTGVAPQFVGQSTGTILAINTQNGTVQLADWQQSGVSRFRVAVTGEAYLPRTPGSETTYGTLNLGPGGFTGAANHFSGSSGGQILAVNSTSGFAGRLADFQRGGVSVLRLVADGRVGVGIGATINSQFYVSRPAVAANPANPTYLRVQGVADTAMTASTEVIDVEFALARTLQFATGALTNQRAFAITAPTYAAVGASTITNAATLYIDNAPVAGTNATLTNRYALWLDSGMARFDGDGTQVFEIGLSNTTAEGTYYGRVPVLIPGVGVKYFSLRNA